MKEEGGGVVVVVWLGCTHHIQVVIIVSVEAPGSFKFQQGDKQNRSEVIVTASFCHVGAPTYTRSP